MEFDEASEAAGAALVHAAARFDTTLGMRLSTYAWPVIRNDLGRLVDRQAHIVRLPQRSRQRMRQINETYHELLATLGRPPSMEEVAAEVRLEAQQEDFEWMVWQEAYLQDCDSWWRQAGQHIAELSLRIGCARLLCLPQ